MRTALSSVFFILVPNGTGFSADAHYVSALSSQPVAPYTNWTTAAQNLQSAVNAAAAGDTVLVSNGFYAGGVVIARPLALISVNGPAVTWIDGGTPCVILLDGASLTGFTVADGVSDTAAGGVTCTSTRPCLTNCIIQGNHGRDGGGVFGGTLYDCTVIGNLSRSGGGACGSILTNCTLVGNYAVFESGSGGIGGGAYGSLLDSCTLSGNLAFQGGGAYACTLYHCTVSSNQVQGLRIRYAKGEICLPGAGGGANGSSLYACKLVGNSAQATEYGGGNCGGGVAFCFAYNCSLTGNSADEGGGAFGGALYNCTVTGNSASVGGGVASHAYDKPAKIHNSIVCNNHAGTGANFDSASVLRFCCTSPLPSEGDGNMDQNPLFMDYAAGDLHLRALSGCINSGRNEDVPGITDLDGNPRIVRGSVDIGAYEYQGPGTSISCAWLQQYGLATDGSADLLDSDADGMNNWQEWVCGTCPTNARSALVLTSAATLTNITLCWESSVGVTYCLERTENLPSRFAPIATNIVGQEGRTTYADTNAVGPGPFFYRVSVRGP